MRFSLILLLAGCPPKTPTPAPPAAATSAAPAPGAAAPAPATPEPTWTAPAPTTPEAPPGTAAAPTGAPWDPAATGPAPVSKQLDDAVAMLTTGDVGRAKSALSQLTPLQQQYPDVAAIAYNIGVAHHILGDDTSARRSWLRATEIDPTFAKAWLNLGALSARANQYDMALANFQAGTRYNPSSVDLRVASIAAFRQLRRYDEAVREGKAALIVNSKAIAIYNNLAMVYLETSQYDLAKFMLLKALESDSGGEQNAQLHALMGQVQLRQGYPGNALAEFKKALELDPSQLAALSFLSGFYLDNRDWSDAVPLLERTCQVLPDQAGPRISLGIAYRGDGRYEDAKRVYAEALRLEPTNPEPHRNLAVLYGDYMKAYDAALQSIEDYRRAGGGPPAELDAWVASIKKDQEKAEKKRKREEDQRRKAQEEQDKLNAPPPPVQAPAPVPGSTDPMPQPAPDPAPQPAPQPDPDASPWGAGG